MPYFMVNSFKLCLALAIYALASEFAYWVEEHRLLRAAIIYLALTSITAFLYFVRSRIGEFYRFLALTIVFPIGIATDDNVARLFITLVFGIGIFYLIFFFKEPTSAEREAREAREAEEAAERADEGREV